jgi:hypothetical protein
MRPPLGKLTNGNQGGNYARLPHILQRAGFMWRPHKMATRQVHWCNLTSREQTRGLAESAQTDLID